MREKKELIQYGALCLGILVILYRYWDTALSWLLTLITVAKPLLMGCAAAYILNLMMSFYERTLLKGLAHKKSLRRVLAIGLSLITLLLILSLIVNMVLPELKSCVEILISSIPAVYQQIMEFLHNNPELLAMLPQPADFNTDFQKLLNQLITWIGSGVGASIFGYLSSAVSLVFNLFVMLIFALYLLTGKEWLAAQAGRLADTYLDGRLKERIYYVLRTVNNSFHRFIVGQCTEAVILGVLCILGMLLLRLPYAVMIGILVGATALIPVLGAYIGGIVGFILIFTESPLQSIIFVVFLVVLQQLENQLIYPRVVGSSIGLPGILVFSAVMTGGSLFGVTGILLGIPLAASAYQLLRADLNRREAKRQKSKTSGS